jgi:hypothetical protein
MSALRLDSVNTTAHCCAVVNGRTSRWIGRAGVPCVSPGAISLPYNTSCCTSPIAIWSKDVPPRCGGTLRRRTRVSILLPTARRWLCMLSVVHIQRLGGTCVMLVGPTPTRSRLVFQYYALPTTWYRGTRLMSIHLLTPSTVRSYHQATPLVWKRYPAQRNAASALAHGRASGRTVHVASIGMRVATRTGTGVR